MRSRNDRHTATGSIAPAAQRRSNSTAVVRVDHSRGAPTQSRRSADATAPRVGRGGARRERGRPRRRPGGRGTTKRCATAVGEGAMVVQVVRARHAQRAPARRAMRARCSRAGNRNTTADAVNDMPLRRRRPARCSTTERCCRRTTSGCWRPVGTMLLIVQARSGDTPGSPAGGAASSGRPGSRWRVQSTASTASPASAAASMSFTTSAGWETIARCPDATSAVVASMRLANMRCASGGSA